MIATLDAQEEMILRAFREARGVVRGSMHASRKDSVPRERQIRISIEPLVEEKLIVVTVQSLTVKDACAVAEEVKR